MSFLDPSRREQRSLFGEILDWMLAPLLLLWPLSAAVTWLMAQNIANKPYDRALEDTVRALAQQITVLPSTQPADISGRVAVFEVPQKISEVLRTDEASLIYYQVLGLRGEWLGGDRVIPVPLDPAPRPLGQLQFRDEMIANREVRVAYLWVELPERVGGETPLVQVAETLEKRSQLATEILKGVMVPQFLILPLAVLLVWLALARGIAPLNELQQRIRQRESSDLSPIDEREAPEEVSPLVRAINDLLARLDESMRVQKHFLADAAHQLKTPLAGLRMQAELAQREIDLGHGEPRVIKRSLRQIARSSQSAAHMVDQLLAMARAEDRRHRSPEEWVDLSRLAAETVRDFVPKAMEKRIDLGYEGTDPSRPVGSHSLVIPGHAVLLRELVRNLLDNALKYTPAGGTVTVRVLEDPFGQVAVLQVEDSGPGIPPGERERVFQPFYRLLGSNVDGSGLGLAIVREIATQHGADVTLEDAQLRARTHEAGAAAPGPGTRFTARFKAILRLPPDPAQVSGYQPAD